MTSDVLFEVLSSASQKKIAVATLNSPETLNGLSLDMCMSLGAQLDRWQHDDSIAFVVLKGAGGKAFCAGGDLHRIYRSMQENVDKNPWNNAYARQFFDVEYRLDYQIHTYAKPVLCWGSGIVMGGGVGLMMGASHRVVSETTRFAMPEITIGLFPDVGGTWLLSRLPGGLGRFMAFTAAQLGASDCRFLGLADYVVESGRWADLVKRMQAQAWSADRTENDVRLHGVLQGLKPMTPLAPGPMQNHSRLIDELSGGPDFAAVCTAIARLAGHEDPWLDRAARTFMAGAPGSARLCFELLRRVRRLSLAEVFRQEYIVSLQCGVQGDLQEGIRALLIDKDKRPKWNPASLEEATDQWVQQFFKPPWPDSAGHPLADLGKA